MRKKTRKAEEMPVLLESGLENQKQVSQRFPQPLEIAEMRDFHIPISLDDDRRGKVEIHTQDSHFPTAAFCSSKITTKGVKWTPLSRPFFAFDLLMSGGSDFVYETASASKPSLAIPALEPALGSHPCGALSSVQVPPV